MTSTDQWMSIVNRITRERDALAREIASLRAALEAACETANLYKEQRDERSAALEATERERDEAHELARKCLFEDAEYAWVGEINKALNAAVTRLAAERDALKERAERAEKSLAAARVTCLTCAEARERMHAAEDRADALREQVEAAERQVEVLEVMDLRPTLDATIASMNSYKAQADALKEQVEELAGWLKLIRAIEREYPQTDCTACQWDSGPFCLPCDKHDVGKLADAALARLDQQETQ